MYVTASTVTRPLVAPNPWILWGIQGMRHEVRAMRRKHCQKDSGLQEPGRRPGERKGGGAETFKGFLTFGKRGFLHRRALRKAAENFGRATISITNRAVVVS